MKRTKTRKPKQPTVSPDLRRSIIAAFFRREKSLYIDGFDPLIKGVAKKTDLMFDRYIAYRAEVGNPISRKELVDAARYAASIGGYGPKVAKSIVARIR